MIGGAVACVLLLWLVGIVRAAFVDLYRTDMIYRIALANLDDFEAHRPNQWRWEALEAVSFLTMVLQFWHRPSHFYRDSGLPL